jgi:Predicted transcriptional regulator containing CBS domains
MIDKYIERFLLAQTDTFMKPAEDVAVLVDEHNVAHAKLLLSQYKYSNVPVVNESREFIGILGLTEIVDFEMAHDFFYEKSVKTDISEIVNKNIETIQYPYEFEELLHKLVNQSFLPVLEGSKFIGIIPRQEVLKAFNAFVHDFGKFYSIEEKTEG